MVATENAAWRLQMMEQDGAEHEGMRWSATAVRAVAWRCCGGAVAVCCYWIGALAEKIANDSKK